MRPALLSVYSLLLLGACGAPDVPNPEDSGPADSTTPETGADSAPVDAAMAETGPEAGVDATSDGPQDSALDGLEGSVADGATDGDATDGDATGADATDDAAVPIESGSDALACDAGNGMHLCAGQCVPNDVNACGPMCTKCGMGQDCFASGCGCVAGEGCPPGQACDLTSHGCTSVCGGPNTVCNGGCCVGGSCGLGTSSTACGANGEKCATSCTLGACSSFASGGSCECATDNHCNGVSNGPRCTGNASAGAGVCGCLSNSDCTPRTCVPFTITSGGTFPSGYCQ